MNLAGGGRSEPFVLTSEQLGFCRSVMARAHMPYAHLDLMAFEDGRLYLSEIRLSGGIHGADTNRDRLEGMKQAMAEGL